jgi:hypothetical protein
MMIDVDDEHFPIPVPSCVQTAARPPREPPAPERRDGDRPGGGDAIDRVRPEAGHGGGPTRAELIRENEVEVDQSTRGGDREIISV